MQHGRNFCCRYLTACCCIVPTLEKSDFTLSQEGCYEKHQEQHDFYSKQKNPKRYTSCDNSTSPGINKQKYGSSPGTFRQRRLTKVHLNHLQEDTDHRILKCTHQQRRDRDRFLYAAEIEGLVEEHPLQTPRMEHSSNGSGTNIPFSDRSVGAYSCHGVEPFSIKRFISRSGLTWGSNVHADAFLMGKPPVVRKINQDRGAIAHPYANDRYTALFSVFDGHGEFGDHIAEFTMTQTLTKLKNHPDFKTDIGSAFRQVFLDIDADLEASLYRESKFSGCTACVVLVHGNTLYMANLGDSRAVLGRRINGGNDECKENSASSRHICASSKINDELLPEVYTAIDLTVDQHPALPEERKRIERCGGHISFSEGADHARVWLDANHSIFGLAMSRSIGDHAMKDVGVTAEPIISTHMLTEDDVFLILATDGVWGVIDSSEAVTLVGGMLDSGNGASFACEVLIETAMEKWRTYEGDYRDDITSIVIRIKDLWEKGC